VQYEQKLRVYTTKNNPLEFENDFIVLLTYLCNCIGMVTYWLVIFSWIRLLCADEPLWNCALTA